MRSAVYKHDVVIRLRDARIEAVYVADQVVNLPGSLDARIPTADHNKRQQPPRRHCVGFEIRLLNAVDDHAAQLLRIADCLHEEGVLRHSRHAAEIDDATEPKHKMLEADGHISGEMTRIQRQDAIWHIDGSDAAA